MGRNALRGHILARQMMGDYMFDSLYGADPYMYGGMGALGGMGMGGMGMHGGMGMNGGLGMHGGLH